MSALCVDLIIVGAGVSGLVTARDAAKAGLKCLLLEGRDRIGGRVWTTPMGDFGASWIHGSGKRNPITQLAEKAGIKTVGTDYEAEALFSSTGLIRDDKAEKASRIFEKHLNKVVRQCSALRGEKDYDASLRDAFDKVLRDEGIRPGSHAATAIKTGIAVEINCEVAADPEWISGAFYEEGEASAGRTLHLRHLCVIVLSQLQDGFSDRDVVFPGGYTACIDALKAQVCAWS